MFKKLFISLPIICLIAFAGCENSNDSSDNADYTFSGVITVGSVSEPITDTKGDLAQLDDRDGNCVIIVADGANLQRMKTDHTGYYDIPIAQYTIIAPGDQIQYAYTKDEMDSRIYPPVIRPNTIRIMK